MLSILAKQSLPPEIHCTVCVSRGNFAERQYQKVQQRTLDNSKMSLLARDLVLNTEDAMISRNNRTRAFLIRLLCHPAPSGSPFFAKLTDVVHIFRKINRFWSTHVNIVTDFEHFVFNFNFFVKLLLFHSPFGDLCCLLFLLEGKAKARSDLELFISDDTARRFFSVKTCPFSLRARFSDAFFRFSCLGVISFFHFSSKFIIAITFADVPLLLVRFLPYLFSSFLNKSRSLSEFSSFSGETYTIGADILFCFGDTRYRLRLFASASSFSVQMRSRDRLFNGISISITNVVHVGQMLLRVCNPLFFIV